MNPPQPHSPHWRSHDSRLSPTDPELTMDRADGQDTERPSPRVLVLADLADESLSPAVQELLGASRTIHFSNPELARDWMAAGGMPELIVVATSRPGQWPAAGIRRMLHAAPLARLVALAGTWCEGEERSSSTWQGAEKVYWHQWSVRWNTELAAEISVMKEGGASSRLDSNAADKPVARPLVAIDTCQVGLAELLSKSLAGAGFSTVWLPRGPQHAPGLAGVSLLIWDDGYRVTGWRDRLSRAVDAMPAAQTVALVGFPRWEDVSEVVGRSVAAVVSKPFLVTELVWQVRHLVHIRTDRSIASTSQLTTASHG